MRITLDFGEKQTEAYVHLTPEIIEREIWEMTGLELARLLLSLGRRLEEFPANVCMQLQNVKDILRSSFTAEDQLTAEHFVDELNNYFNY